MNKPKVIVAVRPSNETLFWIIAILAIVAAFISINWKDAHAAGNKEIPVVACHDLNRNGACDKEELDEYPLAGAQVIGVPNSPSASGDSGSVTCTTDNSGKCKLSFSSSNATTYDVLVGDHRVTVNVGSTATIALPPYIVSLPLIAK